MEQIVFDLETTSLSPWAGEIICTGYKIDDEDTVIDFGEPQKELLDALADPKVLKVGHNMSFDIKWLRVKGYKVVGPYYDTMIAYFSKYPFRAKKLDVIKEEVLKWTALTIKKAKGKHNCPLVDLPEDFWEPYCTQDVEATYELKKRIGKPTEWCSGVEFPLIECTIAMEMRGMHLNSPMVNKLYNEYLEEVQQIEELFPYYVPKANVRKRSKVWKHNSVLKSPQQLRQYLITKGFKGDLAKYLTDGGDYSTGKLAMRALARKVPIGKTILRYRELSKLLSTYVGPWRSMDVLRGSFNQVGAKSSRYSSSNPNMQNIPIRTAAGKLVRSCIIPRPGYKFIVADLSQIEPRLYAIFSQDPKLLQAFRDDVDFHTFVTNEIIKAGAKECDRFTGKTSGLATLYGSGAPALQETLAKYDIHLSLEKVKDIQKAIKRAFKVANKWSQNEWNRCFPNNRPWERKKFTPKGDPQVKTIGGRTINFDYKVNPVNYRMQGSCADMIKVMMLNAHIKGYRIVGMVHDEIIIEVREAEAKKALDDVKYIMENSFVIKDMPLPCDAKIVSNWAEAK